MLPDAARHDALELREVGRHVERDPVPASYRVTRALIAVTLPSRPSMSVNIDKDRRQLIKNKLLIRSL